MRFEDIGNDRAIGFEVETYSLFVGEKIVKIFDKSACQYKVDYDILRMLQKNTYMVISVGPCPFLRSKAGGREGSIWKKKTKKWRKKK